MFSFKNVHWVRINCLLYCSVLIPSISYSFDDRETHPRITRSAVSSSNIGSMLRDDLGYIASTETEIRGQTGRTFSIMDWVRLGSVEEDDPACRASHHFHHPLRPFLNSGVTDQPLFIRLYCLTTGHPNIFSNVTWATGYTSPIEKGSSTGNGFTWDTARRSYLDALTLPAPLDREAALASTFQTLGHVMHLVQDLAVPAHVRNDFQSHLEYCAPTLDFTHWCENTFERFVRLHGDLVDNAEPIRPSILSGQRLTRFWDTDQYSGANPSVNTTQGLAEYTNANFASQNTIFTETLPNTDGHAFPYPGQTSTDLQQLIVQGKALTQVVAEDGVLDRGFYVRKVSDGETLEHFLKAGYLTDYVASIVSIRPMLRLTFQMDDLVLADYAAKLIPRAVGYSAGLLDYFFRGKLDVDLVEGAEDSSVLRLTGTNASDDTLAHGTLKLYADDASGIRRELASTNVSDVSSGQALPELNAQMSQDSERFVAIYQGTLGQEVKNESQNNPGAVIGKVLGGVRVEEVSSDGSWWNLRTANGLFRLPIPANEVAELRWSAQSNMLIGHSPFDPGQTSVSFYVYQIARPADSSEIPLVDVGGNPQVDVKLVKQTSFPFGMTLGTAVEFKETVHYKQYALSFTRNDTYNWTCFSPLDCSYSLTSRTLSDQAVTLMHSEEVPFEQTVSLQLNPDNLSSGANGYLWEFRDFAHTTSGQILALVRAQVFGQDATKNVPVAVLDLVAGSPQRVELQPQTVFHQLLPKPIDVWAVIDVASGTAVASTAPPVARVHYATDTVLLGTNFFVTFAVMFQRDQYIGGPNPFGPQYMSVFTLPRTGCNSAGSVMGEVVTPGGYRDITMSQYRPEIEAVQFSLLQAESEPLSTPWIFLCPDGFQPGANFLITVRQNSFSSGRIDDMRLTTDAGRTRLTMLMAQNPVDGSFLETVQHRAKIAAWTPAIGTVELRQNLPSLAFMRQLISSSTHLALVSSFGSDPINFELLLNATLFNLEGPLSSTLFTDQFMSEYVLLDPDFLYNTADFRFYRKRPPLQRTVLPALLTSFGGWPRHYHTVRLK
jgi:hypothetical protein